MSGLMDLNSTGTLGSGVSMADMIGQFGQGGGVNPAYALPSLSPVSIAGFGPNGQTGVTGAGTGGVLDGVGGSAPMTTWGKVGLGLQGIQTIGGLIGAFGSLSLAKKQFAMQRDLLNTNLKNQIQSYNTQLEDRARSRAAVEGQTPEQEAAYVAANRATR